VGGDINSFVSITNSGLPFSDILLPDRRNLGKNCHFSNLAVIQSSKKHPIFRSKSRCPNCYLSANAIFERSSYWYLKFVSPTLLNQAAVDRAPGFYTRVQLVYVNKLILFFGLCLLFLEFFASSQGKHFSDYHF
jgi:hypothetical protein